MNEIELRLPAHQELLKLRAGDYVLISGIIYTARDRAHKRICELVKNGRPLPFNLNGSFIYYAGPSPAPPGRVIGAAGPTTSGRMDSFTGTMLELGVKGMIGKGKRDSATRELIKNYGAVYLSTFGGAAAYLSRRILSCETAAFEDLGPEAVYRLNVKDFPAVVINDSAGGDFYEKLRG